MQNATFLPVGATPDAVPVVPPPSSRTGTWTTTRGGACATPLDSPFWSRDVKVALKFAAGVCGRAPRRLWVCDPPPSHVPAVNTERDEDEVVVDTRGLQILPAPQ